MNGTHTTLFEDEPQGPPGNVTQSGPTRNVRDYPYSGPSLPDRSRIDSRPLRYRNLRRKLTEGLRPGRAYSADFVKRTTGERRRMRFSVPVPARFRGATRRNWDPRRYNLLNVHDLDKGEPRMINLDSVLRVRGDGEEYRRYRGSSTNLPRDEREYAKDADGKHYPFGYGPDDVPQPPSPEFRGPRGQQRLRDFLAAGGGRYRSGSPVQRARQFAEDASEGQQFAIRPQTGRRQYIQQLRDYLRGLSDDAPADREDTAQVALQMGRSREWPRQVGPRIHVGGMLAAHREHRQADPSMADTGVQQERSDLRRLVSRLRSGDVRKDPRGGIEFDPDELDPSMPSPDEQRLIVGGGVMDARLAKVGGIRNARAASRIMPGGDLQDRELERDGVETINQVRPRTPSESLAYLSEKHDDPPTGTLLRMLRQGRISDQDREDMYDEYLAAVTSGGYSQGKPGDDPLYQAGVRSVNPSSLRYNPRQSPAPSDLRRESYTKNDYATMDRLADDEDDQQFAANPMSRVRVSAGGYRAGQYGKPGMGARQLRSMGIQPQRQAFAIRPQTGRRQYIRQMLDALNAPAGEEDAYVPADREQKYKRKDPRGGIEFDPDELDLSAPTADEQRYIVGPSIMDARLSRVGADPTKHQRGVIKQRAAASVLPGGQLQDYELERGNEWYQDRSRAWSSQRDTDVLDALENPQTVNESLAKLALRHGNLEAPDRLSDEDLLDIEREANKAFHKAGLKPAGLARQAARPVSEAAAMRDPMYYAGLRTGGHSGRKLPSETPSRGYNSGADVDEMRNLVSRWDDEDDQQFSREGTAEPPQISDTLLEALRLRLQPIPTVGISPTGAAVPPAYGQSFARKPRPVEVTDDMFEGTGEMIPEWRKYKIGGGTDLYAASTPEIAAAMNTRHGLVRTAAETKRLEAEANAAKIARMRRAASQRFMRDGMQQFALRDSQQLPHLRMRSEEEESKPFQPDPNAKPWGGGGRRRQGKWGDLPGFPMRPQREPRMPDAPKPPPSRRSDAPESLSSIRNRVMGAPQESRTPSRSSESMPLEAQSVADRYERSSSARPSSFPGAKRGAGSPYRGRRQMTGDLPALGRTIGVRSGERASSLAGMLTKAEGRHTLDDLGRKVDRKAFGGGGDSRSPWGGAYDYNTRDPFEGAYDYNRPRAIPASAQRPSAQAQLKPQRSLRLGMRGRIGRSRGMGLGINSRGQLRQLRRRGALERFGRGLLGMSTKRWVATGAPRRVPRGYEGLQNPWGRNVRLFSASGKQPNANPHDDQDFALDMGLFDRVARETAGAPRDMARRAWRSVDPRETSRQLAAKGYGRALRYPLAAGASLIDSTVLPGPMATQLVRRLPARRNRMGAA